MAAGRGWHTWWQQALKKLGSTATEPSEQLQITMAFKMCEASSACFL
jgi:hypothetical protein